VSYTKRDILRVESLVHALEREGWSVFWDQEIPPGEIWDTYIGTQLDSAAVVVVVWSAESVTSEWVRLEAKRARKRGTLVPVLIDQVEPPIWMDDIQAANVVAWLVGGGGELPPSLKSSIARRIASRTTQGPPVRDEDEPGGSSPAPGTREGDRGWHEAEANRQGTTTALVAWYRRPKVLIAILLALALAGGIAQWVAPGGIAQWVASILVPTPVKQKFDQLVYIQFAGSLTRERITALNKRLREQEWKVQGDSGERVPQAANYNEVRYAGENAVAAAALAEAIKKVDPTLKSLTTKNVPPVGTKVLEVWMSN